MSDANQSPQFQAWPHRAGRAPDQEKSGRSERDLICDEVIVPERVPLATHIFRVWDPLKNFSGSGILVRDALRRTLKREKVTGCFLYEPPRPIRTWEGSRAALWTIAPYLDSQRKPQPAAAIRYEWLDNALIWSDELELRGRPEWDVAAFLFRHRTCLIVGLEPEYPLWWNLGKELFPNWVGFGPERCNPSAELTEFFQRERQRY